MKKLFPVSVAGALALGAVGAHASIAAPSSGTSDAVLFAEVLGASGSAVASYAGDTGQTISQLLSLSSTPNTVLSSDANLTKLFAADNTAAGDKIVWGLIGGQYPTTSTVAAGNTQLITTTSTNTAPKLTDSKLSGMVTAYNAGLTSLNSNLLTASSIEGTNPATAGVWDVATASSGLAFWGTALGNEVTGTTANLYYLTGGGSALANISAALEGTASLSAGGLTLTGNGTPPPPVPLPPAVWLFGSGLLGLAGVARRKAKA
jgi:hypothetical protein